MVWDVSTVSTMSTLLKSLISVPAEDSSDTQNGYPESTIVERNRRFGDGSARSAGENFVFFTHYGIDLEVATQVSDTEFGVSTLVSDIRFVADSECSKLVSTLLATRPKWCVNPYLRHQFKGD